MSLIDLVLFLEFSDDDIVDPDAAMQAMEQLSSRLLEGDDSDRILLADRISALSEQYPNDKTEFIRSIGENLGLI